MEPRYAEAHYNFALALKKDGKEEAAQLEFDKAFQISPELRNAPRPEPYANHEIVCLVASFGPVGSFCL
jgi:hypothetical protein